MLNVEMQEVEGAPLLIVCGRFDGNGAEVFEAATDPLQALPAGPVLLDMEGVDYLSSAGLRSLIRLAKARSKHQSRVWLAGMQTPVRHVFEMAGLQTAFNVFTHRDEAVLRLRTQTSSPASETTVTRCGRNHSLVPMPSAVSTLEQWPATASDPSVLCLSLDELGLAIGRLGLGNTAVQAGASAGAFLSTGNMVCVRSSEAETATPDFIVTEQPAEIPVYAQEVWRLEGTPAVFVTSDSGTSTAGEIVDSFRELIHKAIGHTPETYAWVMAAAEPDDSEENGWVGVGFRTGTEPPWRMEFVRVSPLPLIAKPEPVGIFLRSVLHLDTLSGACTPAPDRKIGRYVAWLYAPAETRPAFTRRLAVVFEDVAEPHEEWDWIARRIYADAGSVRLRELCGGFSAATFQVESHDREGRRLLPTVLKLADPAFSEREDRAYDLYVSKYILNNSAVRMGRCARNGWVGLRYNFLGITGPESQLNWIGGLFESRPIAETLPLFRELFEKILAPWYGQSRPCAIAPYREHDPRHLFPGISSEARTILDISAEQPFIPCPPLERDLPNPYFLLEHVYPARAAAEWPGRSSIVHGDLNLNNVLIDEKENIYVIDFSETHIGDLCGDFSRIEPLVLLQMTRLRDENDVAHLLHYLHAIVRPEHFFDPPNVYAGNDPLIGKAHALIQLLRTEVQRLAGDCSYTVPYLLGLLRWTLPIIAFRQLSPLYKRAACYASALLAEALLEADPEARTLLYSAKS